MAKFDDMPTRFAALVWDRAYYFDTLDAQKVYDFYLADGEKIGSGGTWIAPPEPQCAGPNPNARRLGRRRRQPLRGLKGDPCGCTPTRTGMGTSASASWSSAGS